MGLRTVYQNARDLLKPALKLSLKIFSSIIWTDKLKRNFEKNIFELTDKNTRNGVFQSVLETELQIEAPSIALQNKKENRKTCRNI